MRNVWLVLKRDVKRLLAVPLAMVIIGGALITPALYAWFNIAAFWNPFDNTKHLSIAVTNLGLSARTCGFGRACHPLPAHPARAQRPSSGLSPMS